MPLLPIIQYTSPTDSSMQLPTHMRGEWASSSCLEQRISSRRSQWLTPESQTYTHPVKMSFRGRFPAALQSIHCIRRFNVTAWTGTFERNCGYKFHLLIIATFCGPECLQLLLPLMNARAAGLMLLLFHLLRIHHEYRLCTTWKCLIYVVVAIIK